MTGAPPALRLVFFGTPEFAVATLQALLASRHVVVGVVTRPDRPSGRGQRLQEPAVKRVATSHNLRVLQPLDLRVAAFQNAFQELGADLAVVAAYGKILPKRLLSVPRLGFINVHASLLPKYRGAAPVQRAVMAGEQVTGVTIMRVIPALDAGPMLASRSRWIGPDETSEEIERDLACLGAALLVSTVDALAVGPVPERIQEESIATYAPRLEKREGAVDWERTALELHNQIRALHPWPHAYTELEGQRCILLRSQVIQAPGGDTRRFPPGRVLEATGDLLTVATGHGALRLLVLQIEGRRPLTAREFIAGRHLTPGAAFARVPTQR